jgi:hypothetical protein
LQRSYKWSGRSKPISSKDAVKAEHRFLASGGKIELEMQKTT